METWALYYQPLLSAGYWASLHISQTFPSDTVAISIDHNNVISQNFNIVKVTLLLLHNCPPINGALMKSQDGNALSVLLETTVYCSENLTARCACKRYFTMVVK